MRKEKMQKGNRETRPVYLFTPTSDATVFGSLYFSMDRPKQSLFAEDTQPTTHAAQANKVTTPPLPFQIAYSPSFCTCSLPFSLLPSSYPKGYFCLQTPPSLSKTFGFTPFFLGEQLKSSRQGDWRTFFFKQRKKKAFFFPISFEAPTPRSRKGKPSFAGNRFFLLLSCTSPPVDKEMWLGSVFNSGLLVVVVVVVFETES